MGQRVGGERAHRHEEPRDAAHPQMQQRDPVVPGQGRIATRVESPASTMRCGGMATMAAHTAAIEVVFSSW